MFSKTEAYAFRKAGKAAPVLDVGFTRFSQNFANVVASELSNETGKNGFPQRLQHNLTEAVVATLKLNLAKELKPLKQDIGRTWAKFGTDDDKEKYAKELRDSFEPIFSSAPGRLIR